MLYLILTSEIADQVREQLATAAPVYVPIERAGGVFILPASVLATEAHAATWPMLKDLPQLQLSGPDFPAELPSEED